MTNDPDGNPSAAGVSTNAVALNDGVGESDGRAPIDAIPDPMIDPCVTIEISPHSDIINMFGGCRKMLRDLFDLCLFECI